MGFKHVLNLNKICGTSPYWDYLAVKNNESWLIDVTINTSKCVVEKSQRMVDDFRSAILLKERKTKIKWKLIEIKTDKIASL